MSICGAEPSNYRNVAKIRLIWAALPARRIAARTTA